MRTKFNCLSVVSAALVLFVGGAVGFAFPSEGAGESREADVVPLVRTARSGLWSALATWEGGKLRAAGAKVQIRTGHTATYDLSSGQAIRAIHVDGPFT